ncbi:hypothetical protein Bca4012_065939 [Brassica carinata]
MNYQEMVQRSGFDRIASAFSSPPLDTPTADHQFEEKRAVVPVLSPLYEVEEERAGVPF